MVSLSIKSLVVSIIIIGIIAATSFYMLNNNEVQKNDIDGWEFGKNVILQDGYLIDGWGNTIEVDEGTYIDKDASDKWKYKILRDANTGEIRGLELTHIDTGEIVEHRYDVNGRISSITHVLNGTVTQTTTISYDNDGNVTTELTEHFDPNTGLFTGSTERIDNDTNAKGHTKITKDVDGNELTRTSESDEIEVC